MATDSPGNPTIVCSRRQQLTILVQGYRLCQDKSVVSDGMPFETHNILCDISMTVQVVYRFDSPLGVRWRLLTSPLPFPFIRAKRV